MRPGSRARGELVERTEELALLHKAIREVAGGGSAVVVVRGRPGTGRSALLAEAADLAERAGFDVGGGSGGAPRAVVVDDAQWLPEPPSLKGDGPVLWVVAGGEPTVPDAMSRYEVELRPLSAAGVRALLVERYGADAGEPLLPAALAATGGNPAVLCATLRRWPGAAPGPEELVAVADQVGRHHIRGTLAQVSEHTVALVRASAVGGGDFSFEQLCDVAEVLPPYQEQARAELARTGLLDSLARPWPYDPLVAERVLGLMNDGARHEVFARAVRLGRRDGLPEPVLGRLVAHTRLTEPWVPGALYAAGARARRSGDHAGAVAFLERAVDRGASGALRAEVLLELALARLPLAPEAADRGFRRLLAEETGPDRSQTRLLAADLLAVRGGDRATGAALASAAETARAGERRTLLGLRALALETGLGAALAQPDVPFGPDPAEDAALAWRSCLTGRGIREARRLAAGALARAGAGLFAPGQAAARALMVTEDVDLARTGLERLAAEARRHGVGPAVGQALLLQGELALRIGDLAEARQRLAEAVAEVPRRHWHPRTLPRLTALEALLALESGRVDQAEAALAQAGPDRYEYGLGWTHLLFARGVLGLRTGRFDEATTQLRECGRILLALGCPNPAVLPWRSHLALARSAVDPDAAARLLAEDLAAARAWSAPGTVGSVHLWTGLTLTGPMAVRHLRTAVRVLAGSAARGRYAQAMVELAAALLDAGQPAQGRRALDDALAAIGAGDGPPVPRAQEVAARFAALPGTSRVRLSAAQLRVALLAAEGRSNRAIAQQLAVSLRTVELHLTNTYRALGITGRTDLPAVLGQAVEQRRGPTP